VLFEQAPRAENPNGFIISGGFSAADDFVLTADAIAIGGGLWTYEAAASSVDDTLRYAFWRDADLAVPVATAPDTGPMPSKSGIAEVVSRVPGTPLDIGGVMYTPYEYVFEFSDMVTLLSGVPYWVSFHFGDGVSTGTADHLWAYSGAGSVNAQGTNDIDGGSVSWFPYPTASTAFSLRGFTDASSGGLVAGGFNAASSVPAPATSLLMLPAIVGLAGLGFRQRRRTVRRLAAVNPS
jgi:hypothetical protein